MPTRTYRPAQTATFRVPETGHTYPGWDLPAGWDGASRSAFSTETMRAMISTGDLPGVTWDENRQVFVEEDATGTTPVRDSPHPDDPDQVVWAPEGQFFETVERTGPLSEYRVRVAMRSREVQTFDVEASSPADAIAELRRLEDDGDLPEGRSVEVLDEVIDWTTEPKSWALEVAEGAGAEPARPSAEVGPDQALQTWTFCGHWDGDRIVVDYVLPGEVQDDRVDTGQYEGGLWAASASGTNIEAARTAALAEYESPDADDDSPTPGVHAFVGETWVDLPSPDAVDGPALTLNDNVSGELLLTITMRPDGGFDITRFDGDSGVVVTTYRGEADNAPVVQIDTVVDTGPVRVHLNDATIWDGDPERR